jgi:hypothetical protein
MRTLIRALALGFVLALVTAWFASPAGYANVCLRRHLSSGPPSVCAPLLMFKARVGFSPVVLPRRELTPIAVNFRADIHESDGSHPPPLKEVVIDLDRGFAVEAVRLRACGKSQLEMRDVKAARTFCRESIVGTGVAHVEVESPGLPPRRVRLPLTLFNGGVRWGVVTLLIHSAVVGLEPDPIVAAVKLRKVNKGHFGSEAIATIPKIANGDGSVLDFNFTIKRRLVSKGTEQHYAVARCLRGELNIATTFVFHDGTKLTGQIFPPCSPA